MTLYQIQSHRIAPFLETQEDVIRIMSNGQGFFETLLFESGRLWFPERHFYRLNRALSQFTHSAFPLEDLPLQRIKQLCCQKGKRLRVKFLFITSFWNSEGKPYFLMDMSPYTPPHRPLRLLSIQDFRSQASVMAKHKSISYGEHILHRSRAIQQGYDDCLYLTPNGTLTETSIANIFCIVDNKMYTPSANLPILPGIIRSVLLDYFEVKETILNIEDLKYMDGIIVTNSLMELTPVSAIDKMRFRFGGSGLRKWLKKWQQTRFNFI